jgi:colanic acid/amylovoran biosynthesis glycosyltransferase
LNAHRTATDGGFQTQLPTVGVFVPTFLKPEMLHVYRQVTGIREFQVHVFAFKRENPERFPFSHLSLLPRSGFAWWRRIWCRQISKTPLHAHQSETAGLTRGLRKFGCQLLHVYFGNNGLFWVPWLRQANVPNIVSFHGADAGVGLESATARKDLAEVFERTTRVLARSESLVQVLIRNGCPPEKVRVFRTGIPLAEYPYVPRVAPLDGRWNLLQACRLIEKKGLRLSIEAYAQFRQRWPLATLTIAGDGPLLESLRRQANELNVPVRFTGFLSPSELKELLYQSHIFLHPSASTEEGDQEGIPNSVLEAMATGLPVLATSHGGIPEAVESGKTGLLVPEGDLAGVVDSLNRLVAEPVLARQLGSNASRFIAENFDAEQQARALAGLYREVIERGRGPAAS